MMFIGQTPLEWSRHKAFCGKNITMRQNVIENCTRTQRDRVSAIAVG